MRGLRPPWHWEGCGQTHSCHSPNSDKEVASLRDWCGRSSLVPSAVLYLLLVFVFNGFLLALALLQPVRAAWQWPRFLLRRVSRNERREMLLLELLSCSSFCLILSTFIFQLLILMMHFVAFYVDGGEGACRA